MHFIYKKYSKNLYMWYLNFANFANPKKKTKLAQNHPQLCQLCLGYEFCPFWERSYLNFANFAYKEGILIHKCPQL